ncbi:MAG: sodium:phosphate symporter, partial [Candidatus Nanohalobium sp.]
MKKRARIIRGSLALLLFIFSLQLLGKSTSALSPVIEQYLKIFIRSSSSALGSGWIASYLLMSGSPVASMGLAFLKTGLIEPAQYFMVASGSRLGAALIVVLIGVLEYF